LKTTKNKDAPSLLLHDIGMNERVPPTNLATSCHNHTLQRKPRLLITYKGGQMIAFNPYLNTQFIHQASTQDFQS